jgi:hypothetical protein
MGADSDGTAVIVWGAICLPCFSDFHLGQRNDKPLTSLASPQFEMLSRTRSEDKSDEVVRLGKVWRRSAAQQFKLDAIFKAFEDRWHPATTRELRIRCGAYERILIHSAAPLFIS